MDTPGRESDSWKTARSLSLRNDHYFRWAESTVVALQKTFRLDAAGDFGRNRPQRSAAYSGGSAAPSLEQPSPQDACLAETRLDHQDAKRTARLLMERLRMSSSEHLDRTTAET